jgi:hypothetical protein
MRPAPRVGDIDGTEGADRGVDGEALRRIPGPFDIALQDIVGENDRLSDIVGEIVNALTQLRGHILDIGPRDRLQDDAVEKLVCFEDLAVDRFRRVVGSRGARLNGFQVSCAQAGQARAEPSKPAPIQRAGESTRRATRRDNDGRTRGVGRNILPAGASGEQMTWERSCVVFMFSRVHPRRSARRTD